MSLFSLSLRERVGVRASSVTAALILSFSRKEKGLKACRSAHYLPFFSVISYVNSVIVPARCTMQAEPFRRNRSLGAVLDAQRAEDRCQVSLHCGVCQMQRARYFFV